MNYQDLQNQKLNLIPLLLLLEYKLCFEYKSICKHNNIRETIKIKEIINRHKQIYTEEDMLIMKIEEKLF